MANSSNPGFFKIMSLAKSLNTTNVVAITMKTILVTITICPRELIIDIVGSFWVEISLDRKTKRVRWQ